MEENRISEISAPESPMIKNSTYELVSTVAYLIGVPKHIFERENEPPRMDVYSRLEKDKNARIVRNLCRVRHAIERNFGNITNTMKSQFRTIMAMPEYIPEESILQLSEDGISFYKKSNTKLVQHVIELNRLINDRINNCKGLFPLWINWSYIRELFIMPDGLTEAGAKAAAETYYMNRYCYPYQIYINWKPRDAGNILFNDKKFATLLYEWHGDRFSETNRVSDAGSYVKSSIYDFLEEANKTVVVVDCENSDPYKLVATLRNLNFEYTKKISSIILFDDIHTVATWRVVEQYTSIPVEHMMIERIKENKSLVDIMLTARACQEHYKNDVDSFIIVSSDSDYWGLISSLSEANFLVMVEYEHCGPDLKNALINAGIFYCYIDDFYSGNTEELKKGALFSEMRRYIDENIHLNAKDMLYQALRATRLTMTDAEYNQFYDRYIRTMKLVIAPDGNITLEFKRK